MWTSHLADKIAFSSKDLLQPGWEGAADPLEVLPEDVAEDLHDGGDQGLFFSGLWIRIHILRIRIQWIRMEANTDPDPIRIQGFNEQKLKKNS